MPNKTIYVKEEDIELFEKAQRLLGDSLSGAIAEGLRRLVAAKEAEVRGMKEITLTVGVVPDTSKVRFIGRSLAGGQKLTGQTSSKDDRGVNIEIYQTKKGNILVWWERWSRWEDEHTWSDYAIFSCLPKEDEWLDEGGQPFTIPGELLAQAAEALGQEPVQVLDV